MTIMVTGGTGFVGRLLCLELTRAFPTSRRVLLTRRPASGSEGWENAVAEITDFDKVREIVAAYKPRIILHLAAQASVASARNLVEATWQTNFMGTVALASAVSEFAPEATFIFISSGEVYGRSFTDNAACELQTPAPQNTYSVTKCTSEQALPNILGADNKLIILRPFNHTGPGQDRRFVLPSFASQIVEAEMGLRPPVISVGNLEAKRDFLHVDDVISAYIGVVRLSDMFENNSIMNICSGEAKSVRSYLDLLAAKSKMPINVVVDPAKLRPSEVPCSFGDNSLLKSKTNWSPKRSDNYICDDLLTFWRKELAERPSRNGI